MNAITDTIIAYSEMQMEAIGPNLSLPGHQMLCHPAWVGLSISDDNMAILSPRAYEAAALPYNARLARHFAGLAIHSCGVIGHNIPAQLRTPHLRQMETSASVLVRDSDPSPNTPESLRDGYRGSGIILKVRINKGEIALLERLLAPDLRCALHVTGVESREEAERVYDGVQGADRADHGYVATGGDRGIRAKLRACIPGLARFNNFIRAPGSLAVMAD